MEEIKCYCNLPAERRTSHSRDNPNRIYYQCPKKLKAEQCRFWSWVEDLRVPMGTESSYSQTHASTPVTNMKRNHSFMQELSDSPQASPSQKRLKLIEAALGSSSVSGPSVTSPAATVNNARNISPLQPSPSVGLNANRAAAFPQTPTRSATTVATRSSPDPFDGSPSQRSSTSTLKDESMANSFGSGEITPELIENIVNVLRHIPDHIRKLDRKRIATERSLEARKNKIQYLEDEVKRLKDRQKELERIIDENDYK